MNQQVRHFIGVDKGGVVQQERRHCEFYKEVM